MTTPLTLPTDYDLPTSGLFAVGVEACQHVWLGSYLDGWDCQLCGKRDGREDDLRPRWAQEIADEVCKTCDGTGEDFTDLLTQEWGSCPDCVDGKLYRPLRIECKACDGKGVQGGEHEGATAWYCQHCWSEDFQKGDGFRTVGEVAVIDCVPVLGEDESAFPGCDRFIFLPHPGRSWLLFDSSDGTARSESIHFPSASDYDWALIAQIKETS